MSKTTKGTPKKAKKEPEMEDARGRLRGALNDSINLDDGYDLELPQRGRPSKKLLLARQHTQRLLASLPPAGSPETESSKVVKKYNTSKKRAAMAQQKPLSSESFVMKLFDRSLDLSKYTEQTPLFPICRAWMANQPRNPTISNYNKEQTIPVKREDNAMEVLEKLQNHEIYEITVMPQACKTNLSPIPKALEMSQAQLEESRKLEGASKTTLLTEHLQRWRAVKSNWTDHARKYDQARYGTIYKIMDKLYRG